MATVRMPDGTVIENVPDGTTQEQLTDMLDKRQQPASEESSFGGPLLRQAGLTGRAIAGGAAQVVEPFTEPVRFLLNKVLPGSPIGNIEAATDEALTAVGVPEPQGVVEKGVQSVGRFAVGFAGGFGGAQKIDDAVTGLLGLSKHVRATATTSAELKGIANAAYEVADNAGVVIKPRGFGEFVTSTTAKLTDAGFDAGLHPRAASALKRLRKAAKTGKPINLKEVEVLRRVVNAAGRTVDPDEVRVAGIIRDSLDDYTNKLAGIDVFSGDPKVAMASLKTARDAWHRMTKAEDIAWAVERAGTQAGQFTGSGFENALRTQFRQIAMNKKRLRGFTKEEQMAVKKIASGGKIDNAFRMLGKLAPTGPISGAIGLTAGFAATGSPVGALVVPAVGGAARAVATKRTVGNVEDLSNIVLGNKAVAKDAPDWLLPWLSGTAVGADVQGN